MPTVSPDLLLRILYVLGAGFLLINVREFFQYYRYTRLRKSALLTWAGPRQLKLRNRVEGC